MKNEIIDVTPMPDNSPLSKAVALLAPPRAVACLNAFSPFLMAVEDWKAKTAAIQITDITQVREMKLARDSRLALREIRVTVEKNRKLLKEDALNEGRAIDAAAKIVSDAIEPLETHLLAQEKFAENKESERKLALKTAREAEFGQYVDDMTPYTFFADMNEETYQTLLVGAKATHQQKVEAQQKAELERVAREQAEAAERQRIKDENAKLKLEADVREKIMQAERQQAEAQRKAIEERARKERVAAEAAAKVEREAREKAEAEVQRQKDAVEAKAKADARAARKAAAAPDREKLIAYAAAIRAVPMPSIASSTVRSNLDQLTTAILNQSESL